MALPKWLSKLIRIIEIIFERSAKNGSAIAELTARVEAQEAKLAANSEGDAANAEADLALANRIEELQAAAEADNAEAERLFAAFGDLEQTDDSVTEL